MLARCLYYELKPIIPWSARIAFRRWRARRILRSCANVWPMLEGSQRMPQGWPGWPEGKQFAFVLTHDVEGIRGLDRCRQLMELDMSLGFRSSFNFVPEGAYRTPRELREELATNGFEVGVHDLRHDGKLYRSRRAFSSYAVKINACLKEWGAVGFRSGFMHHNLDWLNELSILYDASTFDTDPFEPQPDGVNTIFPFIVPGRNGRPSYVELPYTLVQDFSLFVVLKERTVDIWKRKLDWIAKAGGMALLNVHPDYLSFQAQNVGSQEFGVALYREFLEYVRSQYGGSYWHALPKEVAEHTRKHLAPAADVRAVSHSLAAGGSITLRRPIWIDLDNTPHIPFFKPIIRELKKRGYEIVVSARDAYQVCELADHSGIQYTRVGRHYGKNPLRKLWGTLWRTMQLIPFVLRHRPCLSLSHGSRSQIVLSNLARIPSVLILDYEHAKGFPLAHPTWAIVPQAVSEGTAFFEKRPTRIYEGLKEDVYVPEFRPDGAIYSQLGLDPKAILVTVRPPATEAHYHNPQSEGLFTALMDWLSRLSEVQVVLLPRNKRQEAELRQHHGHWFRDGKVRIPEGAVDGLNVLWHSDLVVSGGGTMNREAAAMDLPVYSIFRGHIGAVDRRLAEEQRLVLIESVEDLRAKIAIKRREKCVPTEARSRPALRQILAHVEEILRVQYPS